MLNRTVGSVLLVMLLMGGLSPAALANEKEILTLEKAQEIALANSPLLKLSELEYEEKSHAAGAAYNAYRDAQREIWNANYGLWQAAQSEQRVRDDLGSITDPNDPIKGIYEQELRLINQTATAIKDSIDKIISARREQKYVADLADVDKARAKRQLEDRKRLITRQVEDKYYIVLLLDQQYQNLQEKLNQLVELQRVEDLKVSLGLTTPLTRSAIGAEAENTGQLLQELSTLRRLARQDFNTLLGRDLDDPLNLVDDIVPSAEPVLHPGYGTSFVEESASFQLLQEQIKVQRERLQDLEAEYSKGDPKYLQAQKTLERLELERAQAREGFRMALITAYNRTREMAAALRSGEAGHRLAQERLRIARLQYDAGLISRLELRARQNEAREGETLYRSAVYDYNLAVTDYNLALEGIIIPGEN